MFPEGISELQSFLFPFLCLPLSVKYSLTQFSQWKCGYPWMISLLLQILSLPLPREEPDASLSSLVPFKVKRWFRFFCPLSFIADYLANTLLSSLSQKPQSDLNQMNTKWKKIQLFCQLIVVFSPSHSAICPDCVFCDCHSLHFHCLNSDLDIQVLEDFVPLALVFPYCTHSLGHLHAHSPSWHELSLYSGAF